MFDPLHIGKLSANYVKVVHIVRKSAGYDSFKAVVTLQGHTHALLLKPNLEKFRDQIVIDRMKHLFGIQPMHVFGLQLNFVYEQGEKFEGRWQEYFAMALSKEEVLSAEPPPTLKTLEPNLLKESNFRMELCKIVLFRYLVGSYKTCSEHILIRNGMPVSVSENKISSAFLSLNFISSLPKLEEKDWLEARKSILSRVDLDSLRGIILQTRKPERSIDKKAPKGPLSLPVRRITEIIEERLTILEDYSLQDLLGHLTE